MLTFGARIIKKFQQLQLFKPCYEYVKVIYILALKNEIRGNLIADLNL